MICESENTLIFGVRESVLQDCTKSTTNLIASTQPCHSEILEVPFSPPPYLEKTVEYSPSKNTAIPNP